MKPISSKPPLSSTADRDAWWREWFNQIYLDVYAHRDDRSAEIEAEAALSILPLHTDHRLLDLCCGNGRHCRALRRKGFQHVTGLDYSLPLLEYAMAETPRAGYVRGDMRLLPFPDGGLDAVLSFFTSFGYFPTDLENLTVLNELGRVLKPGGCFLLDYLNPSHVRRHLVAESIKTHGEFIIHERRSISSNGERIEKEIAIENWGDHEHRYRESVRMYEREQMGDMLQSANLQVDGILGSFGGEAFGLESPRMILYGRRIEIA